MPSAFDDRTAPESSQRHPLESAPPPVAKRVDLNQMFTLIDGILPFEACLYYQVLPLSIEGSRLNLGMVDPDDRGAADYVRRMLSYINCSIVSCKIPSDWHRNILSQYLSYTAKSKGNPQITAKTLGGETSSSGIDLPQAKAKEEAYVLSSSETTQAMDEQITTDRPVKENSDTENEADITLNEEPEHPVSKEYDLDQQNFRATLVVDTPDLIEEIETEEDIRRQKSPSTPIAEVETDLNADSPEQLDTPPPRESNPVSLKYSGRFPGKR